MKRDQGHRCDVAIRTCNGFPEGDVDSQPGPPPESQDSQVGRSKARVVPVDAGITRRA